MGQPHLQLSRTDILRLNECWLRNKWAFRLITCAMDWLFKLGLRLTLEIFPSDHSTLTNFLSFTVSDEHALMHPDILSARPQRWLELATAASIGSGNIYSRRPRIWHQTINPHLDAGKVFVCSLS